MADLPVPKTCKLYVNGAFVRSESGRTIAVTDHRGRILAHVCHGSRKDVRDAVEAARHAQESWAARSAYNRGQILYRMAEMLEGRRAEFVDAIAATRPRPRSTGKGRAAGSSGASAAKTEVDATIDRLLAYAGWADKIGHVLGGENQVVGPYYDFTTPEAIGVAALLAPEEPALLGLVSLIAPPLCAGDTVVVVAGVQHPFPAVLLGELCATSDVPAGVVNVITGRRRELIDPLCGHREVDVVAAANLPPKLLAAARTAAAANVTRVEHWRLDADDWLAADRLESPWTIEPFIELKTIWHPSAV